MDNISLSLLSGRPAIAKPVHKWMFGLAMLVVVCFGWYYPLLGFAVPAVMLTGMVGGLFKGRYVCGNICPRGSFFDTYFSAAGSQRALPDWMLGMPFRWVVLVALMGFMVWRVAQNPGDIQHWGQVFWSICAITTAVGVVFGLLYSPRAWCGFCPMGTLQNVTGGRRMPLQIASRCNGCAWCEERCPMQLSIARHRDRGELPHRDCLKCSTCVQICPEEALGWSKGS